MGETHYPNTTSVFNRYCSTKWLFPCILLEIALYICYVIKSYHMTKEKSYLELCKDIHMLSRASVYIDSFKGKVYTCPTCGYVLKEEKL